jgi:hypothetical protein
MNNFLVSQLEEGFSDLSQRCMLPPGTTEAAIMSHFVRGYPKLHGINMQAQHGESHKQTRANKFHSTVRPASPRAPRQH